MKLFENLNILLIIIVFYLIVQLFSFLNVGLISPQKKGSIKTYIKNYPEIVDLCINEREQLYSEYYNLKELPPKFSFSDIMEANRKEARDDFARPIYSAATADTFTINRKLIRLIRKQIFGSVFVDEGKALAAIGRFNIKQMDFNPGWFLYGGSYLYPAAVFVGITGITKYGLSALSLKGMLANPEICGDLYVAMRVFSALSALIVILLLMRIAYKLYDKRAALLLFLLVGGLPYITVYSHISKPYNTAAMWACVALLFLAVYFKEKKKSAIVICGIFNGLAVGANYFFAYFSLLLPIYLILSEYQFGVGKLLKKLVLYGIIIVAVFLIVNPYWLFNLNTVKKELVISSSDYQNPDFLINSEHKDFWGTTVEFIGFAFKFIVYSLNLPALAILVFLIVLMFKNYRKYDAFALSIIIWILPLLCLMIYQYSKFGENLSFHYCGYVLIAFYSIFGIIVYNNSSIILRKILTVIILIGFIFNAAHSYLYISSFKDINDRNIKFGKWIENNILPHDGIIAPIETFYSRTEPVYVFVERGQPIWTQIILPDYNFLKYNWTFKYHFITNEMQDFKQFPQYIIDVNERYSLKNENKFLELYKIKCAFRKKNFGEDSMASKIFPFYVNPFDYSDYYMWELISTRSANSIKS